MRPNPQFPADLVTFTEKMLNGKLRFMCSDISWIFSHILLMSETKYTFKM